MLGILYTADRFVVAVIENACGYVDVMLVFGREINLCIGILLS